jgi:3-oxoacyl-[acyl-carrier-protein] synthase III
LSGCNRLFLINARGQVKDGRRATGRLPVMTGRAAPKERSGIPMRLYEGTAGARILAFGGYQPARVITNDDLASMVDTSDEWIKSRVGIASRRVAGPDETVTDMAVAAGGKALAASGLSPADVDLVIVATCTAEVMIPNASAIVAKRLGITAPGAYDINAACAGFCYALASAADAVRAGSARHALVIGAEKLSQWVDWTDRSTCIIFADGAGAAVIGPVGDQGALPGIGPVVWGSDGDMADKIYVKDRYSFIVQEGQAVFRWATTALHPVARQACESAGVDPHDLAVFVPHQANLRIIEALARKLGASRAKVASDIVTAGNTSSASIPLALSNMAERGEVSSGDKALLIGFGAGVCYAAQVIAIP